MNNKTAPCPNCGNQYGPTQMIQKEKGGWYCPSCHIEFEGPKE